MKLKGTIEITRNQTCFLPEDEELPFCVQHTSINEDMAMKAVKIVVGCAWRSRY